MQISRAIRDRQSVRAFAPQPVPKELVGEMLELAKWAPSWANTQDWNVYALTGAPLDRLRAAMNARAASAEPPVTDVQMPGRAWPEYLQKRMVFRRPPSEAPEARDEAGGAAPTIWDFYGAPWLLLFAIDERLAPAYACFDTALLVQTVCLAAEDRGLSTCIMAMAVRFPELIHRMLPSTADKRFVVGVALGYADPESSANRNERARVDLGEIVSWIE